MWQTVFVQPFHNLLVALTALAGGELWVGIALLTLVIQAVLIWPTRSAIRAQGKMQILQPEIAEIQKKYKNNPQRLGEETMKLWKKHGVSPVSGCLPILAQMPFLLAVFFVLRHFGEGHAELLYSFVAAPEIDFSFFWVGNLATDRDGAILPLAVGGLTFLQIWLSNRRIKKAQKTPPAPQAAAIQKMMMWGLPAFLVIVTAGFPAGLALYWALSAAFRIAVQETVLHRPAPAVEVKKPAAKKSAESVEDAEVLKK